MDSVCFNIYSWRPRSGRWSRPSGDFWIIKHAASMQKTGYSLLAASLKKVARPSGDATTMSDCAKSEYSRTAPLPQSFTAQTCVCPHVCRCADVPRQVLHAGGPTNRALHRAQQKRNKQKSAAIWCMCRSRAARFAAHKTDLVSLMPRRKWSSQLPANSALCSAGLRAAEPVACTVGKPHSQRPQVRFCYRQIRVRNIPQQDPRRRTRPRSGPCAALSRSASPPAPAATAAARSPPPHCGKALGSAPAQRKNDNEI